MSKKKILIVVGILLVAILAVGTFFFLKKPIVEKSPLVTPSSQEPQQESLLTYEDEAGFTFQYPSSLGVVEVDMNDKNTYSSLELMSKAYPNEKLTIKIVDTSLKDIDSWLKQNSSDTVLNSSTVSLSGISGKSLKYANKNQVVAIDNGILYLIESPKSEFWNKAFESITSTFQLAPTTDKSSATQSGQSAGDSSSGIIDEGEEVIE